MPSKRKPYAPRVLGGTKKLTGFGVESFKLIRAMRQP